MNAELIRCPWAERSPIERAYHDRVWGVPLHDEQGLFGMLCLEGMQAGLSWVTVLRKMGALRTAFDDFDPQIMAGYDERRVALLMETEGAMMTGWLELVSGRYYLEPSGAMVTGTQTIEGVAHLFAASGAWQAPAQGTDTPDESSTHQTTPGNGEAQPAPPTPPAVSSTPMAPVVPPATDTQSNDHMPEPQQPSDSDIPSSQNPAHADKPLAPADGSQDAADSKDTQAADNSNQTDVPAVPHDAASTDEGTDKPSQQSEAEVPTQPAPSEPAERPENPSAEAPTTPPTQAATEPTEPTTPMPPVAPNEGPTAPITGADSLAATLAIEDLTVLEHNGTVTATIRVPQQIGPVRVLLQHNGQTTSEQIIETSTTLHFQQLQYGQSYQLVLVPTEPTVEAVTSQPFSWTVSKLTLDGHQQPTVHHRQGGPVALRETDNPSDYVLRFDGPYTVPIDIPVDRIQFAADGTVQLMIDDAGVQSWDADMQQYRRGYRWTGTRNGVSQATSHTSAPHTEDAVRYRNAAHLLPFYHREYAHYVVNQLPEQHPLASKAIQTVYYLAAGTLVTRLQDQQDAIDQLKVVYADNTTDSFALEKVGSPVDSRVIEYRLVGTPVVVTPNRLTVATNALRDRLLPQLASVSFQDQSLAQAAGYRAASDLAELYLEQAFAAVQQQLPDILSTVLQQARVSADEEARYTHLVTHKHPLLLGLAYLHKWYDLQFHEANFAKGLLYQHHQFGAHADVLDWLIALGQNKNDALLPRVNDETYRTWVAPLTQQPTIPAFLTHYRQQWLPQQSDNDWFKAHSKAYIAERQPQSIPTQVALFDRLKQRLFENMYLPLLTVSDTVLYVIPTTTSLTFGDVASYIDPALKKTNPDAYATALAQLKERIDRQAQYQTDHLDMWYRLALPEVRDRLSNNRITVFDSLFNPAKTNWSAKEGPHATLAVQQFFGPSGRYHNRTPRTDALSYYEVIWFNDTHLLRDHLSLGGSIWTHEMVHALEDSVYLGGHGLRPGVGQESYAEGLFQSVRDRNRASLGFNNYSTLTDAEKKLLAYVNTSPHRFRDAATWQTYTKRLLDALYVMDYAEAQAIMTLPATDKQKMLGQMRALVDPETGQAVDQVVPFSLSDIERIGFHQLDDFIEHHAVSIRHDFIGAQNIIRGPRADRNTYVSVPLFSPMYGLLENATGASGGYTFRRTAFELLAHKGYRSGMIPYLSNQLAASARAAGADLSDRWIVQHIFADEPFNDLQGFKKAMFAERINRLDHLKPVTIILTKDQRRTVQVTDYATLQQLMTQAVTQDARGKASADAQAPGYVFALKQQLLSAYIAATNEFESSLFTD